MSEAEEKKPATKRTDARRKSENKYKRERLAQVNFRLNKVLHGDVLDHLAKQPNKRQYIISLIREDIAREQEK